MRRTVKSSLLWGLVGALSFLVLVQGYHLVASSFVDIGVMAGGAAIVGLFSAVATHLLRPVVRRWNESP